MREEGETERNEVQKDRQRRMGRGRTDSGGCMNGRRWHGDIMISSGHISAGNNGGNNGGNCSGRYGSSWFSWLRCVGRGVGFEVRRN